MLLRWRVASPARCLRPFQWAPTLGGECYCLVPPPRGGFGRRFNGHPPLGVNATESRELSIRWGTPRFNGHPLLGVNATKSLWMRSDTLFTACFNGHPPLGVNATGIHQRRSIHLRDRFNGHPPLGVNATTGYATATHTHWNTSFNGHPPLGVNATRGPAGSQ